MSSVELDDGIFSPGYSTPELTHEEPSRAVFAAWQNCAIDQRAPLADRELQIDQLHAITQNACSAQSDAFARETLERYSGVLEYLWFGNDHTPLPEGLRRFLLPDDETPVLSLNPYLIDHMHVRTSLEQLHDAGLGRLLEHRQRLYNEQCDTVFTPLAQALVENTPGYRLLESFISTHQRWEERPLTSAERILEAQMAERRIRQRYSLSDREPIFNNPNAQLDLNRAVQQLDEATRFDRREEPEKPPRERAIDFFTELIIDDSTVHGNHLEEVQTVKLRSESGLVYSLLRIATDETTFDTDGESVVNFAETKGLLNTPTMSRARAISAAIVSDMVLHLFDRSQEGSDYLEVLEMLLDGQTRSLIGDMGDLATGTYNVSRFNSLVTLLTAPTEFDEALDSFILAVPMLPDTPLNNRLVSRKELRKMRRETLGHIQKRFEGDGDMRVMQYSSLDESIGAFDEAAADTVLHIPDLNPRLVPRIPGYEIVGADSERQLYGLRYTPEADPYAECRTLIPDEQRHELASTYADLGLSELATLVQDTENLTVGQLRRFVRITNRYIIPSEGAPITIPDTLEGYSDQVQNGKLSMQCVGSSHFMRLSLDAVFGSGSAGVINGDTIPQSGSRITRARHQQTTFIDPETNQLYIIDATSSGTDILMLRDVLRQQMRSLRRLLGSNVLVGVERSAPPAPPERELTPLEVEVSDEMVLEHRRTLIAQTRDALVLQLRMVFGRDGQPLPQDRLFETVAELQSDDIVFRSLSAAILATQGRLERSEAAQLVQYMEALRRCNDRSLLQKVDPRGYTTQPRLIGALITHITQLARLVD